MNPMHVRLAETAKRLITKHGTELTFKKLSNELDTDDNPIVLQEVGTTGVQTDPSGLGRILGDTTIDTDMFKDCTKLYFVSAVGEIPLNEFHVLVDENTKVEYRIHRATTLKPGKVTMLHFVGVVL